MKRNKALYVPTFVAEIANAVSHGVTTLAPPAALPFAAVRA